MGRKITSPWYNSYFREPDYGNSRFVDPHGECRTKESHPYSYDPYFLIGNNRVIESRRKRKQEVEAQYSDRLWEWKREKYDTAFKTHVNQHLGMASAKQLSAFLSEVLEKDVTAIALAEGANQSTGYPYWIFWYVVNEKNS